MQQLTVLTVQYHPTGQVTVLVQHELGGMFPINTNEAAMEQLRPGAGDSWRNADAVAAAQAALDDPAGDFGTGRPPGGLELAGKGYTVVWPTVPPAPAAAPLSDADSIAAIQRAAEMGKTLTAKQDAVLAAAAGPQAEEPAAP